MCQKLVQRYRAQLSRKVREVCPDGSAIVEYASCRKRSCGRGDEDFGEDGEGKKSVRGEWLRVTMSSGSPSIEKFQVAAVVQTQDKPRRELRLIEASRGTGRKPARWAGPSDPRASVLEYFRLSCL